MQAQTLQVRRNIRFPWKVLLVVALVAVMFAVGIGVATSGNDTTTVPVHTVVPIQNGFALGPSTRGPNQVVKQAPAETGGSGTDATIVAPNGKPLT